MAKIVREGTDTLITEVLAAFNAFKREAAGGITARVHADVTSKDDAVGTADLVSAADASSLATSVTLVNDIKRVYNRHLLDGAFAHKTAGTAVATADATNLATAQTLANAIKASYEAHRASTTHHYAADSTNTIAAADATDQGSLNTLANELKTDINAHIQTGFATRSLKLVAP